MEAFEGIVSFFQSGGFFMYPIMGILAIGLAIALERYIYLSGATSSNRKHWDTVVPMLQNGKYSQALKFAGDQDSAISRIIDIGLNRAKTARRREDIEMAMEEALLEAMPRLERRTHFLAMLANIATLMGLLGTIIGLIAAFTAVANADPAEKANMLSASISIAMNTTAFGLIAAIPLVFLHSILQTKTQSVVGSLEMAMVRLLNIISEGSRTDSGSKESSASSVQGSARASSVPKA